MGYRVLKGENVIPSSRGPISPRQGNETVVIVITGSNATRVLNAVLTFHTYDPARLAGITSLPLKVVEDEMNTLGIGGKAGRGEPSLVKL